MVKEFFASLVQKLFFWSIIKSYIQTRYEKKLLEQQVKVQQNDLDIASQPCYQWKHLIDKL